MMAQKGALVYLGFEDEEVGAEGTTSRTNKIGGLPDWPEKSIENTPCGICGMKRSLVLQLYAPLEQSLYHRTFFIFACLRPTCSQNARSWTCLRIQNLEPKSTSSQSAKNKQKQTNAGAKIKWCNNFDDWGQESCDDKVCTDECNGNANTTMSTMRMQVEDSDDEDDDGNVPISTQTLVNGLSQLNLKQNKEPNANCAAGLAVSQENEERTFAEIESEETDLVLAEAPIKPSANLIELLQTTAHSNFTETLKDLTLKSFYLAVDIEQPLDEMAGDLSVEHIQEIYDKYKIQADDGECLGAAGGGGVSGGYSGSPENCERYETALPLHGDIMFHNFLSTIKMNPTQVLRYTRDAAPLLIEPLTDSQHFKCQHCNGPTLCEVQILSTIIPKLQFQATGQIVPLDFGNVLIFTCLKSCWDTNDKLRFENVVVQNEK